MTTPRTPSKFWREASLVATLIGAVSTAHAQAPKASGSKSEVLEEAQGHVNDASTAYRKKDFTAALESLKKAEMLAESANDWSLASIGFNIARCHEQLEQWDEALRAYEKYLTLPDEPGRKERAWAAVEKLKGKVNGRLTVSCFPTGATLRITGGEVTEASCPLAPTLLRPGTYLIEATAAGHESGSREVVLVAGQRQNVQLELTPNAVVPPMTASAEPPSAPVNPVPWAVLGGGATFLAVGGAFHGLALSDKSTAEAAVPGAARDDVVASFELKRSLAFAGYGIGAAAVVTSVLLFMLDFDDEDPEAMRMEPASNGVKVVF